MSERTERPSWTSFLARCARQAAVLSALGIVLGLGVHFAHPAGARLFSPPPRRSEGDPRFLVLERVRERFEKGGSVAFLDARAPEAFARGHIEGAWNLPATAFDAHFEGIARFLGPETEIIVYCDGWHCSLSEQVMDRLGTLGYVNVRVYEGGWEEWRGAGLPAGAGSE
ncbi:MAG: rhodanese-like domain-containing protein [Planctomycetes bacterium]|nr:rhodanese-like domain-containing protein [Planctomycetota bacterium]